MTLSCLGYGIAWRTGFLSVKTSVCVCVCVNSTRLFRVHVCKKSSCNFSAIDAGLLTFCFRMRLFVPIKNMLPPILVASLAEPSVDWCVQTLAINFFFYLAHLSYRKSFIQEHMLLVTLVYKISPDPLSTVSKAWERSKKTVRTLFFSWNAFSVLCEVS